MIESLVHVFIRSSDDLLISLLSRKLYGLVQNLFDLREMPSVLGETLGVGIFLGSILARFFQTSLSCSVNSVSSAPFHDHDGVIYV